MVGSESLRNYAVLGQVEDLRALLAGGGNPLGADECGLNSLHYAVWNGHIECIKILLANDIGVDEEGVSRSCLNAQTKLGMTPLHIAALEGWEGPTTLRLLLLAGCDASLTDVEGRTAEELARSMERWDCVEVFDSHLQEKEEEIELFKQELQTLVVRKRVACRGDKRGPAVPKELEMDEDAIRPFADENVRGPRKAEVIRNLVLATDQSQKNEARRENLANSVENNLKAKGIL